MMTNNEAVLKTICILIKSIETEDFTDQDLKCLKVAEHIVRQVKAGGSPFYPIKRHLEETLQSQYGAQFDLDVCIDYYMHDSDDPDKARDDAESRLDFDRQQGYGGEN